MDKSTTPRYVIELWFSTPPGCRPFSLGPMEWRITSRPGNPGNGRVNVRNLERFIMEFCESLVGQGFNRHISDGLGYIPYPSRAIIRRNNYGAPAIAVWKAAPFQVFPI